MIRNYFCVLLYLLIFAPFVAKAANGSNPEQVVNEFQKIPHFELFCKNQTWGSVEPFQIGAKFNSFLSNEFGKLFMWSQCLQPNLPPQYDELNAPILWDVRFGFPISGLLGEESVIATNVRISSAINQASNKVTVKALYNTGILKNIVTVYKLVREDDSWKIDDIAPKGYTTGGAEPEELLRGSKSIKTAMQNNYRKAEARYQQELAKKKIGSRPKD